MIHNDDRKDYCCFQQERLEATITYKEYTSGFWKTTVQPLILKTLKLFKLLLCTYKLKVLFLVL